MSQSSLWHSPSDSGNFAELCNALYQREIGLIAKGHFVSNQAIQARLKSLTYYVTRTAHAMAEVVAKDYSPLSLDIQNASWSAKQSNKMPTAMQKSLDGDSDALTWYLKTEINVGLVVPVIISDHVIIDCIDRIDTENNRLHTNVGGWFSLAQANTFVQNSKQRPTNFLLKPTRAIMASACAGHNWQRNTKQLPIIPSLRELLLSCAINWKNFKKPLSI
jgi:hypothetical protein